MRAFSLVKHGAAILGLAGVGLAFGAGPRETDHDWLMKQLELTDGYTSGVDRGTSGAAGVAGKAGAKARGRETRETDHDWFMKQLELTDGYTPSVHRGAPPPAGVEGKPGARKGGEEAKEGKQGADPAPTSGNTEFRYMGAPNNPWQLNVSP